VKRFEDYIFSKPWKILIQGLEVVGDGGFKISNDWK